MEGPLFQIVSTLFKSLIDNSRIIVPGFQNHYDPKPIRSSIKASEGLLYPLQKSFLFINNPVFLSELRISLLLSLPELKLSRLIGPLILLFASKEAITSSSLVLIGKSINLSFNFFRGRISIFRI
jgi:hypothetical protein